MADSIFMKDVGRQLQSIRRLAGWKSAELFANSIDMKTKAYTEYEQGRRAFNYEQAWTMADALDCSLDELGGRKWKPSIDMSLDPGERKLIDCYRHTNETGKRSIVRFAEAAVKEFPDGGFTFTFDFIGDMSERERNRRIKRFYNEAVETGLSDEEIIKMFESLIDLMEKNKAGEVPKIDPITVIAKHFEKPQKEESDD